MPKEFTGSVDAPSNMRFGADNFVDTTNPLESLPEAANLLAKTSHGLVLQGLNKQISEEEKNTDEFYSQARKLKRNIYDSAQAQDDEAVAKYSSQLEDLKIAERQGAISGSNSQIRQESLLKSYVNRFPHLEEDIRQLYSSRRTQAQAQREQFKDPIEDGIDALIEEGVKTGRGTAGQIEWQQAKDGWESMKQQFEMRAAIGADVANEVGVAFDQNVSMMVFDEATRWIHAAGSMSQGDFNSETAKSLFNQMKVTRVLQAEQELMDIVKRSPNEDAVLSRDFVNSKKKEIADIFDQLAPQLDSYDTLKNYTRAMEIGKIEGIQAVMKMNPVVGFLLQLAPEKAGEIAFKDWDANLKAAQSRGLGILDIYQQRFSAAGDSVSSNRVAFQRMLIKDYLPHQQAADMQAMFEHGTPPQRSGDDFVDGVRLNAVVDTAVGSKNLDPKHQASAAGAALDAESQWSKPGDYVAPGSGWYKNPQRAEFARKNPEFKKKLTTTINNTTPGVLDNFGDVTELQSVNFVVQAEQEVAAGAQPWKAYQNGGPFSSSFQVEAYAPKKGEKPRDPGAIRSMQNHVVAGLNNSYWNMRNMYSPAEAEAWALKVLALRDQRIDELLPDDAELDADGEVVHDLTD